MTSNLCSFGITLQNLRPCAGDGVNVVCYWNVASIATMENELCRKIDGWAKIIYILHAIVCDHTGTQLVADVLSVC